jgi:tRNA-splicing endonuclease subunit Sen2
MSTPGRGGSSSRGNRGGKSSSYARTRTNNLKYGTPLPIIVPASPLHPAYTEPPVPEFILARRRAQARERGETGSVEGEPSSTLSLTFLVQLLSKLSSSRPSREAIVPRCKGTYDPFTRSVFVTSPEDRNILFDRGFFGKGNLSRSEASWKTRRVKLLQEIAGLAAAGGQKDGMKLTAEEVTAARRKERKQFKIDRAQAILNASLAAEAILRSSIQQTGDDAAEGLADTSELQRVDSALSQTTISSAPQNAVSTQTDIAIPSVTDYAHVLPEGVTRLTPQTFLQRPTRPDAKPKGRRPPPASVSAAGTPNEQGSLPDGTSPATIAVQETSAPTPSGEDLVDPDTVEDLEHLQLNLEEAFFLSWAVGCLDVINPKTVSETLGRMALRLPIYRYHRTR